MSGTIHYSEMIKQMDRYDHERSDETFSLVYDECDRKRVKGGDRVYVAAAKKCGLPYHCADHEMRGIIDTSTGKTTGVHLRLVFMFNDLTVYW